MLVVKVDKNAINFLNRLVDRIGNRFIYTRR